MFVMPALWLHVLYGYYGHHACYCNGLQAAIIVNQTVVGRSSARMSRKQMGPHMQLTGTGSSSSTQWRASPRSLPLPSSAAAT